MQNIAKIHRSLWLGALLLAPALVLAQTETGRISGTVVDPSGGVVPGAQVTVTSQGGAVRTTVADSQGRYAIVALQPGVYDVAFEAPGFKTQHVKTRVTVGASIAVDGRLQIGSPSEEVNVTVEEAPQINTITQDVSTNINQTQLRELPTITRNPYDFVQLAGNSNNANLDDPAITLRGANGFSINGQRASSTNILLDGAANNSEFDATIGQDVPLDSVKEFSVITSDFSAQFGRATGGIVNVATKAGTNDFHGSAYEYFRDNHLATNTFDNKARGKEPGTFTRHQMGASLGGPIVKDKLHFFGNFEYIRVRSIQPTTRWVVTPAFLARTGAATQAFFNKYPLAAAANGVVLTKEQVPGASSSGAFAGLPAGTPVFQQVVYNLPTDAGGGLPRNDYQGVARIDWSISPSTQFYARYAVQDQTQFAGTNADSPYQGFDTGLTNKNHNILGSLTHSFGTNLTSQTKVVFNRLAQEQPLGTQPPGPTLYMFNTRAYAINGVNVAFPGYLPFSPGNAIPFGGPQKLLQAYEDATWVKGKHEIRVGGSFERIMDDRTFGAYENPVQTLGGNTGQGLDNLVTGNIVLYQAAINPQGKFPGQTIQLPVSFPDFSRQNRYNEWAAYVNDSLSVTSRLKLNLGVRYEYYGVQHNKDPRLDSNFYYGPGAGFYERIRTGQVFIAPDSPIGSLWKPDRNNFAPRVGFAWDVLGNGKMSLRGGYGIAYERNFGNVTFNVIQNPPNYATISLTAPADIPSMPIYTDIAGPLAGTGSAILPVTQLRAVDPNIVNAWSHFWSLSLQKELFAHTAASVEYTGSRGVNLYSISNINRQGDGAAYLGDASVATRANTTYSRINSRANGGKSTYHGVTFGLDSLRLGQSGLSFTLRYTMSWAKDDLSTTFSESANEGIANGLGFLDPLNPELDWGWADFDVRRRFVGSAIWDVPLARSSAGLERALLKGWQIAAVGNAQSGSPFSIADCTNGVDFYCARMAVVAPINSYVDTAVPGSPNTFTYLDLGNQAAGVGTIASPLTGTNEIWKDVDTSRMSKRNAFRRPGRWNVDATLAKRFDFGNRASLQLRCEVYNLFNHANLYVNGSEADASTFNTITAFRGFTDAGGIVGDGQRRIQLAARVEF